MFDRYDLYKKYSENRIEEYCSLHKINIEYTGQTLSAERSISKLWLV